MEHPIPRSALLVVLVLLSVTAGIAAVGAASSTYEVSVPGSIDVPDRTVEASGQEIEITSVARVGSGEDIDASTDAPDDESYLLLQYNNDGEIDDFTRMEGSDSTTFPTDGIDSGTYLLVLDGDDGSATQPVVVAAYDANITLPEEAAPGETVNVTVELTAIDSEEPTVDSVELVLMDGDDPDPIELTTVDEDDDVYETELTVPEDEDEYTVFSTAFGEDSIAGTSEQEMLEITETSIEVTEDAAEDDSTGNDTNVSDPDDDNDDAGGGTGGGTPADDGEGETDEDSGDTPTDVVQQAQATTETDAESGGSRATFDDGSPVEEISFEGDVEGTVNVTTLESEPADVEPAARTTVQLSEITVPEDARDSAATIRMTVDTARLEEHDATAGELRVERFSDGAWESLETTVVEDGSDRVVLEARTPGFSVFAVTAQADASDDDSTSTDDDDGSADSDDDGSDDDGGDDDGGDDDGSDDGDSDDGSTETDGGEDDDTSTDDDGSGEAGDGVTDEDTPGFGVLGALVAVAMLAAAAVTRTRRTD